MHGNADDSDSVARSVASAVTAPAAANLEGKEQCPAKRVPVRVAKLRENNNVELQSESTGSEGAGAEGP
jgi:hypothetical protein